MEEKIATEEVAAIYDPSKKYEWGNNARFILNGQEFAVILNAVRFMVSSPEAQRILAADRANQFIESALSRAVETGVAKEKEEIKKASN